MNRTGNLNGSRAKSVPLYELLDKDGNSVETGTDPKLLAIHAERFWPGQEQDPDETGAGWNVRDAGFEPISFQRAAFGPVKTA